MPVRTRRMKNSGNGAKLPEGSSSSNEDIEMSHQPKVWFMNLEPRWIQESRKDWRHLMRMSNLNHQWFKKTILHSYYSIF
jgi:hypothetical protein